MQKSKEVKKENRIVSEERQAGRRAAGGREGGGERGGRRGGSHQSSSSKGSTFLGLQSPQSQLAVGSSPEAREHRKLLLTLSNTSWANQTPALMSTARAGPPFPSRTQLETVPSGLKVTCASTPCRGSSAPAIVRVSLPLRRRR